MYTVSSAATAKEAHRNSPNSEPKSSDTWSKSFQFVMRGAIVRMVAHLGRGCDFEAGLDGHGPAVKDSKEKKKRTSSAECRESLQQAIDCPVHASWVPISELSHVNKKYWHGS